MRQLFILMPLVMLACARRASVADDTATGGMEPGAWTAHVTTAMRDPQTGEAKKGPDGTMDICLTPEFLAKDPYLTPLLDEEKMARKQAKCTTSDHKRVGNSASWKVACTMSDGSKVDMLVDNVAARHKATSKVESTVVKDGRTFLTIVTTDMSFAGKCTKDMPRQ